MLMYFFAKFNKLTYSIQYFVLVLCKVSFNLLNEFYKDIARTRPKGAVSKKATHDAISLHYIINAQAASNWNQFELGTHPISHSGLRSHFFTFGTCFRVGMFKWKYQLYLSWSTPLAGTCFSAAFALHILQLPVEAYYNI